MSCLLLFHKKTLQERMLSKELGSISMVEIRLELGRERDWNVDWTEFKVRQELFIEQLPELLLIYVMSLWAFR